MIPEVLQPYVPLALSALKAIAIFIIGWMVAKQVHKLVVNAGAKASVDVALSRFLGSIARYTVLAAAVIAALGAVGIETTSIIAVFASAGLAIGLALQGSLANFAAGVMILFFRPFELADKITVAGETGQVKDIGLFALTLHTPQNTKVIIPNSAVTGGNIKNHTALEHVRGDLGVGVAYGEDLAVAQKVLLEAAAKVPLVIAEPAPSLAFVNFGASSLDLTVMCWCKAGDYLNMLHAVRVALYDGLNEAGIEIPFDQIVIHKADAA